MATSNPSPPRSPLGVQLPDGLVRRSNDRVAAGVCAGVGRWLEVEPAVVRLAAVILTLADGFGIFLYLLGWVLIPLVADETSVDDDALDDNGPNQRNTLAIGFITLGLLLALNSVAPVFPEGVVWPAALAATGLGVVWFKRRSADSGSDDPLGMLTGPALWVRIMCGGSLLICAVAWFLHNSDAASTLGSIGLAVLATLVGIAVLVGPWIFGLFNRMNQEHRERIRSEERADMAAHLHDSVLQTLALIQRQAESPQQARTLARRQERELRAWLFDSRTPVDGAPTTLAAALDVMSDEVEADHAVTVDVVIVGDRPVDSRIDALVAALREAVVNAAIHSGESEVSVYVEVEDSRVDAYVRDRGKGFDPAAVEDDRRGIADSIVGRMLRHGGRASVRSAPGDGTEVALHLDYEAGAGQ